MPSASPTGVGSTSVKWSNLVSSTSLDWFSETKRCTNGDSPSTRHVTSLWEKFFSSFLLKEATKLLLQFWWSKPKLTIPQVGCVVCWKELQYRFRTCLWCSQFPGGTLWGGIPGKLSTCLQICHFFSTRSGWWRENWQTSSTLPCTFHATCRPPLLCYTAAWNVRTSRPKVLRKYRVIIYVLPYHSSFSPPS